MRSAAVWSLILGCVVGTSAGCDEEREVAEASSSEAPATPGEPASDDEGSEAAEEAEPVGGDLTGTVDGEPFVTRGVLAHRLRESDPTIEIRIFERAASCASFDADYESREGEPIVIVNLAWPKSEGDSVSLRAREVHERLQFCEGRESGRALCSPRAQEQGSLTVVEASPEGGTLSFDVSSDEGSLSGRLEFTLCSH